MAAIDSLPPDQRAAVQLLLKQGQSYEQLADLLRVDADAVRDRAHAALDKLGAGAGADLGAADRARIADYLLGQQGVGDRAGTRDLLSRDPVAGDWAHRVADQLEAMAPDTLPELPAAPAGATPATEPEPAAADWDDHDRDEDDADGHPLVAADRAAMAAARVGMTEGRSQPAADDHDYVQEPAAYERQPSTGGPPASRIGGALLLGGVAIVVAVVLILVIGGGDDDGGSKDGGSTLARSTPTQTSTTKAGDEPIAQINLFSPDGGQKTVGLAQIFARGADRAIVVAGQGLAQGTYALWIDGAPGPKLLGFVPQRVGANGRFATQGELPKDARRYKSLLVTREDVQQGQTKLPTKPGKTVLRGTLKLS